MATWQQVVDEAPELAAAVRERFARGKHCTMATLRKDGSPRISGTEVQLEGDDLRTGSMPGAVKALDLQRDPRVAIHSPTVDPPEADPSAWAGEAEVSGRAEQLAPGEDGAQVFRIELEEVVLTVVEGDELVVRSWHAGRGVQERRRT